MAASSNSYGFDFLKNQHKLDDDDDGQPPPSAAAAAFDETATSNISGGGPYLDSSEIVDARNKPDLEKQYDILAFLRKHRGSGSALLPSTLIYRATGVDLESPDEQAVTQMLQNNPKVRTEYIPDPENPALRVAQYAYQAKYPNVRDRTTLLAQINRMREGIPVTRDLLDSYDKISDDIACLITAGDVIAIQNTEDKDKILFPRGESFFVELDGQITVPDPPKPKLPPPVLDPDDPLCNADILEKPPEIEDLNIYTIETDIDPTKQIRRGEAIQVGGQWFRVSSAVKKGVPLQEQPARAQAPLSVVSLTELSKRNEIDGYVRPFTSKQLPLDAGLSESAQNNVKAARQARERLLKLTHGRSGGGVTGQLTGSYAHASNPTTLASSLASGAGAGGGGWHLNQRKRPNVATNSSSNVLSQPSGTTPSSANMMNPHQQKINKEKLQKAATDPALALYSHVRRHGCTRDVREMYLQTRKLVPESDHELQQKLLEHKLLEPGEMMRRPRLASVKGNNVDNDGKPKKRRYYERKNQRMTNTHLEGTEIGAILARAAEKQKQGKSVGDGGM